MKEIKYILALALVGSALSSCGLYTKYERADQSETVDKLYDFVESTSQGESLGKLTWQELFADPALQALIVQGLSQNTDLNVARLNVEQAEIALKTARLAYTPTVNLSGDGTISNYNGSTSKSYALSLSASWEIDIFGRVRNAKEQSKAALEQSEAYRQAVQTELVSTIANNYYTLLMLDEKLRISRLTLKNWEENIRSMQALKRAGRINQTGVLQTEASKVSLEGGIVSIEQQIATLESTLSALLAQPSQHIKRGVIADVKFPSSLSLGVPMELLSNRPDVRVAEYNLTQMFYAVNEARASLYPSITLGGSVGFTNSNGVILNPGEILSKAIGSIVQPLFNGRALRGQLEITKSMQEQAELQFRQALLDSGAEVNSALIEWQSARKLLDFERTQIDLLRRTVTGTELLMKHGSATYIEVLTAQLSLLASELSYAENQYGEIQGVINLYRALGGAM